MPKKRKVTKFFGEEGTGRSDAQLQMDSIYSTEGDVLRKLRVRGKMKKKGKR